MLLKKFLARPLSRMARAPEILPAWNPFYETVWAEIFA
jgi:hypothetical protein